MTMTFDALYHLYQTLYWSIAALLLVGAVGVIGFPLLLLGNLFSKVKISFSLALLIGQCELIVAGWFAFKTKQSLAAAFVLILTLNAILLLVAGVIFRARVKSIGAELFDAVMARRAAVAAFCLYAMLLAFVVTISLGRGDLNLVTIGNLDIFHYVKLADFVLSRPTGPGNIVGYDIQSAASADYFGAYAVLSFAAFLLRTTAVDATIAPVVAAGALIGAAVSNICHISLRLPRVISFCSGLLVLGNSLFLSLVANYFLAQILSAAMLLIAVNWFLSAALFRTFDFAAVSVVGLTLSTHVLFTYPILLVPDFGLFILLAAWLHLAHVNEPLWPPPWKRLLQAMLVGLSAGFVAGVWLLALASPLVLRAFDRLSSLDQFTGGWPLGLISPLSMIGIPLPWHEKLGAVALLEFMAVIAITAVSLLILVRDRHRRDHLVPITLVGLTAIFFAGYLLTWIKYGFSYQQWKFAGSYTAIFGFGILAGWIYALRVYPLGGQRRRWQRPAMISASAGLVLLAVYNWADSVSTWLVDIIRFPQQMKTISAVDEIPEISGVIVDLQDAPQRMLAAAFIRKKSVTFLGPTYYGPGIDSPVVASGANPILRDTHQCGQRGALRRLGDDFILTDEASWPLGVDQPIFFNQPIGSCLKVEGVGAPEAWGRWTLSRTVTFSFDCQCREDEKLGIALRAGAFIAPGGTGRQTVRISVNGTIVEQMQIMDEQSETFVIPLPIGAPSRNRIKVQLELPDATYPNASDGRALGLSLIDFALVKLPRRN